MCVWVFYRAKVQPQLSLLSTATAHSLLVKQMKCVWVLLSVLFCFFILFFILFFVGGCVLISHCCIQWLGPVRSGSLTKQCQQRPLCLWVLVPTSGLLCAICLTWALWVLLCSLHNEGLYILFKSLLIETKSIVCTSDKKKKREGEKNKTNTQLFFFFKLNDLFCRTWLEQKPVQGRSLRTGVENHYLKSENKPKLKKKKKAQSIEIEVLEFGARSP